jgi:hypothetical protein
MRGSAIVANGVYVGQQTTRDGAVRDTQAWKLAFTEEGRTFALSNGFQGSMLGLVEVWPPDSRCNSDLIRSPHGKSRPQRCGPTRVRMARWPSIIRS